MVRHIANVNACFLVIGCLSLVLCGCEVTENYEELMTLKSLRDNQAEINDYLKQQEESFTVLLADIKHERIKPGMSKKAILDKYGEPVFSEKAVDNPAIQEILFYRYPTEYFSSDRVYFYFNNSNRLEHWEYKPYKQEEAEGRLHSSP